MSTLADRIATQRSIVEATPTDPEIAAYVAANPEPLFRQFPSGRGRYQHAGRRSTEAQDRPRYR